MNTRECIAICVGIIGVVAMLVSMLLINRVDNRIEQFTEVISQPGLTSEVTIERVTFTLEDGDTFELTGLEAEVNSRVLDLIMNAIIETEMR